MEQARDPTRIMPTSDSRRNIQARSRINKKRTDLIWWGGLLDRWCCFSKALKLSIKRVAKTLKALTQLGWFHPAAFYPDTPDMDIYYEEQFSPVVRYPSPSRKVETRCFRRVNMDKIRSSKFQSFCRKKKPRVRPPFVAGSMFPTVFGTINSNNQSVRSIRSPENHDFGQHKKLTVAAFFLVLFVPLE